MYDLISKRYLNAIVLALIIILGAFLYLYKLGEIPPGLGVDEAANGVNAYSILLTGKDEYGKASPISFKFAGSYSPPIYTYLTVPVIGIFGLKIASIRVISAISGIISILVIYMFIKGLNLKKHFIYLGTLLYAISPWTIMYSRSGYEAMLSFLIYTLGVFYIWLGFKKPIYLSFGFILLSLSIYTSYANKFLVPLLLISLFLSFRDNLFNRRNLKYFIAGGTVALIVQLPNLSLIFTKSFFVKNSLSYSSILFSEYEQIKAFIPAVIGIPYLFIREFLSQYLTYFSLRSLFLDPDPFLPRSIPDLSVFYPWMFIPYLVGLFVTFKNRTEINYKFLLVLAIIAPIPAAFTKDPFWTYRAMPLLMPLIIIITIGIYKISQLLKSKIFIILFLLAIFNSLFLLWKNYFVLLPNERAIAWQYGYQGLADEISKKHDHFVIDDTRSPYTYWQLAFFLKIPPKMLQNSTNDVMKNDYYNNVLTSPNRDFENLEIRAIDWKIDVYRNQILVGDSLAFSDKQIIEHELSKVFVIRDPLNNIVFEGFQTNPSKKCGQGKKLVFPQNPLCKFL